LKKEGAVVRFRQAYWQAYRGLETVRLRQWERSRMTLPQLRVLFAARRTPGILPTELARELGTTISTTSGLVSKLVGRGLLERGNPSQDRRQTPLFLTPAGSALAGEMLEVVDPFLLRVAGLMNGDIQLVTEVLERVAQAAQEVWADLPDSDDNSSAATAVAASTKAGAL
jgi:MarR family transcriptional regulator, temperature-dependent positive regulator of motility